MEGQVQPLLQRREMQVLEAEGMGLDLGGVGKEAGCASAVVLCWWGVHRPFSSRLDGGV